MPALEVDDFAIFAGHEHMFFRLHDPFGMVREETEQVLRRQVPETVLERIEAFGNPKFLTLGKKTGDGSKVVVAHFAFCFRAHLTVSSGNAKSEVLDAAITFLLGNVDSPGSEVCRTYFDLQRDAEEKFTDEEFESRFLTFRSEL